jgi:hypothetical protein
MTLQPLETCETAHCMAECGTTTSSGDAGAPAADGGASCTSLAACCAMLTSAEQSGCTDVVAAGQATDCQEALSAYMSANLCH